MQKKEQKKREQESQRVKRSHIRQLLKKKQKILEYHEELFQNWRKASGISKKDFWRGLCWLALDPMDAGDGLRNFRELGCSPKEGLVKLKRVYEDNSDCFYGFYRVDNNFMWCSTGRYPSINIYDVLGSVIHYK